jgi:hypothetical protein
MNFMKAADVGIERVEVREEELQHQQLPGSTPGMTLERGYMKGRYGAVPLVGKLNG